MTPSTADKQCCGTCRYWKVTASTPVYRGQRPMFKKYGRKGECTNDDIVLIIPAAVTFYYHPIREFKGTDCQLWTAKK